VMKFDVVIFVKTQCRPYLGSGRQQPASRRRGPVSIPGQSIETCGGQNGTATGFSPGTSVIPCQNHSAIAPYSLSHLPPTRHNSTTESVVKQRLQINYGRVAGLRFPFRRFRLQISVRGSTLLRPSVLLLSPSKQMLQQYLQLEGHFFNTLFKIPRCLECHQIIH
jgi:hypothetical protein